MNRVEIVNLAGRARHIESAGAIAIDAWLAAARSSLELDPDRDEIMLDFERAISEKCDARLSDGRDVVTADEAREILESLGTIEVDEPGAPIAATAARVAEERPRRLYRLPGERMIAGVCSGMAAWLRVDVTVVRVAWVILPLLLAGFTDGAAIPLSVALYALLAFVLPRADSPEARAAAHGYGATAQDRLMQVRAGTEPALSTVGSRLGDVIRFFMRFTRVVLLLVITALLATWVVGAGWLAVAGEPLLTVFGEDVSSWLVPILLTSAAVLLIAPLAGMIAVMDFGIRAGSHQPGQGGRLTAWLLGATAAWATAATLAVVVAATIPGVRDTWADGEGRIAFGGTTYCFVRDSGVGPHCQPGDEIVTWDGDDLRTYCYVSDSVGLRCQPGDEIVRWDDERRTDRLVPVAPKPPEAPLEPVFEAVPRLRDSR